MVNGCDQVERSLPAYGVLFAKNLINWLHPTNLLLKPRGRAHPASHSDGPGSQDLMKTFGGNHDELKTHIDDRLCVCVLSTHQGQHVVDCKLSTWPVPLHGWCLHLSPIEFRPILFGIPRLRG